MEENKIINSIIDISSDADDAAKLSDINELTSKMVYMQTDNDRELTYQDRYMTEEQKKRDHMVTLLLDSYVKTYQNKTEHLVICRYLILVPCIVIVCIFAGCLQDFSNQLLLQDTVTSTSDIVAFATACITFVSLIIGLLTIITKYFFPENDEQYITKIVETIQTNDLENKRENAKNKPNPPQ